MVLDSNVDPRRVWYPPSSIRTAPSTPTSSIYFKWIAKYHDVFRLGGPAKPSRTSTTPSWQPSTPIRRAGDRARSEWTDLFFGAAYYIFGWEASPTRSPAGSTTSDWRPLKALYDSAVGVGNDNNFAVYLGVQCTDAHWPPSCAEWRADASAIYAKAPFLDVGQHVVQRAVPLLAGQSSTPSTSTGATCRAAFCIARPRRGDAL